MSKYKNTKVTVIDIDIGTKEDGFNDDSSSVRGSRK